MAKSKYKPIGELLREYRRKSILADTLASGPRDSKTRAQLSKLDDEIASIEAQIPDEELAIMESKSASAQRIRALGSFVSRPTPTEYNVLGSVKHIRADSREEAETKAYRFAMWMRAYAMRHGNPKDPNVIGSWKPDQKAIDWCKVNGVSETTDQAGGALVPPEFSRLILDVKEQYGAFRANARVVPMGGEVWSAARRTGDVVFGWVDEGGAIPSASMTWDGVGLHTRKLGAMLITSGELNDDAMINLADEIVFDAGYALAKFEDQCGFLGDGTSAYRGITGLVTQLKELDSTIANIAGLFVGAGNAYSELLLTDFEGVAGLLPANADGLAGWFVHKRFYHSVMQKLERAAGGSEEREGGPGTRPMFLGYPVNFTQVMPFTEANSQVCALLGDLRQSSLYGDRRQLRMVLDPYSLSDRYQIRMILTTRFDIINHSFGNASPTAGLRVPGPVVGLITAAS